MELQASARTEPTDCISLQPKVAQQHMPEHCLEKHFQSVVTIELLEC